MARTLSPKRKLLVCSLLVLLCALSLGVRTSWADEAEAGPVGASAGTAQPAGDAQAAASPGGGDAAATGTPGQGAATAQPAASPAAPEPAGEVETAAPAATAQPAATAPAETATAASAPARKAAAPATAASAPAATTAKKAPAATAAKGPSAPADGVYTVASSLKGSARVEIGGASRDDGARTQVYADNWSAAQRWYLTSLGNGYYKVRNVASGKYLDVAGGRAGDGARVQQWAWNGTKAQQWAVVPTSSGYLLRSALSTTYVLDLAGASTRNGTAVQLYRSNGTGAQRWTLTRVTAALPDGFYRATSQGSGRALDVSGGSVHAGANVRQYASNGSMAQGFQLSYAPSTGYYTVLASASGLALDVGGAANRDGANVQLWSPNGTAAQRWAVVGNADGTYTLRSAIGGRVLDVSGGSKADGANVQTWAWNGTGAQRWKLANAGAWTIPEGVYNIVTSVNQANSLAVAGSSRGNSANVRTASTSVTSWGQKWVLAKASGGYYTIRNLNSRKALDVSGGSAKSGTNVQQYAQNNTAAQLWKPKLTAGGIVFQSKLNGAIVLDIAGASRSSGANVQIYSSNGTVAQKFRIRKVSAIENGKSFIFSNLESGKVLDVAGASKADGAAVQLYQINGTAAQRFRVVSTGEGSCYLVNANSQKCLDVDTNTKTKLQQWQGQSGSDKQWVVALDTKSGAFTMKSVYTGKYLDGTSGVLSLQARKAADAQLFELQPLAFTLYLDAGHIVGKGGYDSGATGNGYTEAQLTSDLTDRILKICRNEYGLDVVDGKTFGIPYYERTGKAVDLGCTAFLSIHFNAGGGSGCMSIVGGSSRNENSVLLNSIVHPYLSKAMSGLHDYGTSYRGDLSVVNNGRIPATLLEIAFIDNSHDMQVYNSRRDSVARNIAEAILKVSQRGEFNK